MLEKIENPQPIPEKCDVCKSLNIELTDIKTVYGTDTDIEWPVIWFCHNCKASVGCHQDTMIPFGLMADQETRSLRKKAHDLLDICWLVERVMTRHEAYLMLSEHLQISAKGAHISLLTKNQLFKTIKFLEKFNTEKLPILIKRKERNERRKQIREERRISRENRKHQFIRTIRKKRIKNHGQSPTKSRNASCFSETD